MRLLWLFWLETLAFIGFMLWSLLARPGVQGFTAYERICLTIYLLALIYTLYHFIGFVRGRMAAR
jgi:hypothetical protein